MNARFDPKQLIPALFALGLILTVGNAVTYAQQPQVDEVKESRLGETRNVHTCGSLFTAGQPTQADIALISREGIKRVISLRTDGEVDWDEEFAVRGADMEFVSVPFGRPESLTDEIFDEIRKLLRESDEKPTLLHCGSANRVGAVWMTYRVLDQGVDLETATAEAKTIGLRTPALLERAVDYIKRQQDDDDDESSSAVSVKPGINDRFLDPDLDVEEMIGRFEVESREIFAFRSDVVAACQLEEGQRVADIGAGTGLFTRLFAEEVGDTGWVFAIDISSVLAGHLRDDAEQQKRDNISVVLCAQDSISLPPESIDVAFICDTYHHFEYPQSSLHSIHRALSEEGALIVIDFERIPGQTRPFLMSHVRAGKDVFRTEIESAGFGLVEEVDVDGLEENYFLRFRKR